MRNAAGIVSTHAQTMRPATPQRTADSRRVAPTPTIAPVIACVVDTGTPVCVAIRIDNAALVSAANPPTGCSFVIFDPIVWMMRHPPASVPRPIAVCAASTTQNGMSNAWMYPAAKRTPATMPIVFCASLAPWFRLKNAADRSCRRRNHRSTRDGGIHRKIHRIVVINASPRAMPMSGDSTMKMSVLVQPLGSTAAHPARATAAPAYPPIRACDELVGRPKYHVMRSQTIAPVRPPKITAKVTRLTSIMPEPTVLATAVPKVNAATKLKNAAQTTALPGDSTRVDTTVAIELAASWKPLM